MCGDGGLVDWGLEMSFALTINFAVESCYKCAITFAVTQDFQNARMHDHATFYCPMGHGQVYGGKSQVERDRDAAIADRNRVQAELNEIRHAKLVAEKARDKAVREKRKVEKRIAHGVCPCCDKTFANVSHHMMTEHKDFRLPGGKLPKQIEGVT